MLTILTSCVPRKYSALKNEMAIFLLPFSLALIKNVAQTALHFLLSSACIIPFDFLLMF